MKNYKYRFTIFTPCYNSEKFIHRVFNSVSKQTYRNFEWLIINDASKDDTIKLINEYKNKADFDIALFDNEVNRGLYYNFNKAFSEANGELMIFAGHDDEFESNTLELFDKIWQQYGSSNISGIWARCKDQFGNIIGTTFPQDLMIANYHNIFEKYIYGDQERFGCTRTDILKRHQFNLETGKMGEGFLWGDIGLKYDTIYINDVLRTYYREENNTEALTKRSRVSIAKETYLYYVEFLNSYYNHVPSSIKFKLRYMFATVYYASLANIGLLKLISSINDYKLKLIILMLYPMGLIFSYIKK